MFGPLSLLFLTALAALAWAIIGLGRSDGGGDPAARHMAKEAGTATREPVLPTPAHHPVAHPPDRPSGRPSGFSGIGLPVTWSINDRRLDVPGSHSAVLLMAELQVLDEINRLLDVDGDVTVKTSMRLPASLRDAAALALRHLGVADSTTSLMAAAMRRALETAVTEAALEAHFEQHPHARPSLAEVALTLAAQDGSPLADRPDRLERAAAQVLASPPDADAHAGAAGSRLTQQQPASSSRRRHTGDRRDPRTSTTFNEVSRDLPVPPAEVEQMAVSARTLSSPRRTSREPTVTTPKFRLGRASFR